MRKSVISFILVLAPTLVFANARGSWPDEARGGTFTRPAWVLVVPAKRLGDGGLVLWDRTNPWVREWIVPQPTPSGLRTVAIVGDSEDKRLISNADIDNMQSSALERLARKYNAPAVAVAVSSDSGDAVIAAWAPGRRATWDFAEPEGGKKGLLQRLDGIFTGRNSGRDIGQVLAASTPSVRIIAQRQDPADGKMEYRLRPSSPEAEQLIAGSASLSYNGHPADDGSVIEVKIEDGREIEAILKDAGVSPQ